MNEEISNQMSRKLNEIKTSLNSQIQDAIAAAITSTVLPSIQNTLEMQGRPNFTMVDRGPNGLHPSPRSTDSTIKDRSSSGLQRNSEVGNSQKTWGIRPKTCFMHENSRQLSRQSSGNSNYSEQNRDTDIFVWDCIWDQISISVILKLYLIFVQRRMFFASSFEKSHHRSVIRHHNKSVISCFIRKNFSFFTATLIRFNVGSTHKTELNLYRS